MPPMSPSQARVIDPVLTQVARGYQNAEMVGLGLFPAVPVGSRGGNIIEFNKESFQLYNTQRSPGANTKRVFFGYAGKPYTLAQHALEGMVPWELMGEASAVPGINLGSMAVQSVQDYIAMRLEKAQADIATNAATYAASNKVTLSGTSQWSDYGATSNPSRDIETAKEAIRTQTGRRGNTVLMGAAVFAQVRNHPLIRDAIKYTGRDAATPEQLATLWGVNRVLVGDSIYNNGSTMVDVWGKFVVVAYTDTAPAQQAGRPTFGYTYRLDGAPYVEEPYNDRNAKSWLYPVTDEVQPVIAGADAGYLISAAIA